MFFNEIEFCSFGEEPRLRMFENRALRKIFERGRDDLTGGWKEWQTKLRGFKICTLGLILLRLSNQRELDGQGTLHEWG
jgi:hypothetical protein